MTAGRIVRDLWRTPPWLSMLTLSPGGWTVGLLVVTVKRSSLTPSTWSTCMLKYWWVVSFTLWQIYQRGKEFLHLLCVWVHLRAGLHIVMIKIPSLLGIEPHWSSQSFTDCVLSWLTTFGKGENSEWYRIILGLQTLYTPTHNLHQNWTSEGHCPQSSRY
jgi:hypothetical protein